MAQYDGAIRIATSITTKDAEESLASLSWQIKKSAKHMDELRSKMDALKDEKIPKKDYKDLQKSLAAAEKELQELIAEQERYNEIGITSGDAWDALNGKVATASDKVDLIKEKMQTLTDAGKDFTLGKDTAQYKSYEQQLQYEEQAVAESARHYKALLRTQEGYKKLKETVKSAFSSIGSVLKKANSAVNAFGRKIREVAQNHLRIFRKEAEKTKGSMSGFAGRLKSLALSLLIFNQISAAFQKVSSSISAGFKNLYDDNEQFKSSIDGLRASVLTLQNAFSAAFRPIVDMAVPYIEKLVEWLTHAVNLAGQFFAALTGRKTYTRAIKQTAKASEEAAEAAEEETDAMQKQLSSLDKLNNLTSENNKKKNKDKDDSGAGTGIMFEEVPIESGILDMVDRFKDIMSKIFAPLKEAWNREGKFVMDSWKYALNEVWKLIKDIGRDFLTVWQQEKTIRIFENLLHIIGDIGLTVGHLTRNFKEAWNENETGLHILENIRDIIGVIVHNFRLAADETVKWADKLDFGPLLESFEKYTESLIPLADALSGILSDFYTKVLLPLGTWTVEKGLPELLDVLTKFNEKVDWENLRKNLSEFWEHLEPFAETVGEGLILFIERVSDALADFLNSQEFKDFLVTVKNWMDSVTPEDVADALELIAKSLITLKLALLGYSAIKGIADIFSTIRSFLAIFGIGGSAATTAATMDSVATAATGLSTALSGLAAAAAVVGSYKLLTGHLEELFAAFGKSTDQGARLEERYKGIDGAARFAKDGIDTLKNGIEGYGFAADNCVGSGVAIEKAMEDIANGAILSDHHMEELQKRFSLTDEDMEMLRQEMLDTNPILREIADNLGFEGASAETLYDIAEGFSYIANGIEPLPNKMSEMTDEARDFISRVEEGVNPMEVYGEKLENIGSIADNANESLNNMGKNIADGVAKGMEEADVDTASEGFFSKILSAIKGAFGIASPAKNMMPVGEFITLGILEGFRSKFEAFTYPIQQLCSLITSKITNGMQSAKVAWFNAWMSMKDRVGSILSNIREAVRSAVDWISQKIKSIMSMLSGIRSTAGGFFSGRSSSSRTYSMSTPTPYAVYPAIAKLSNIEIPQLAKGAVLPANREFLALVGDQKHGTNVEAPLDTIKQALREEAISLGLIGKNETPEINLNLTVECAGYQLLNIMQKLDSEYFKQTGRHALA